MERVLVLGGRGMLGSMVVAWLADHSPYEIHVTCRTAEDSRSLSKVHPNVLNHVFDATSGEHLPLDGVNWVVNAIGVIKPYIHDDNRAEVERAIGINSIFPTRLAEQAEAQGVRVIQIATDCVYSGREGERTESSPHDATDAYGKTKSLGEVQSDNVTHLRCSIVGPEVGRGVSLLSWFLGQQPGASVSGFKNHSWNGVTTLHFAKLCAGIIGEGLELPHVLHVVPENDISKDQMLGAFSAAYGRADITVNPVDAAIAVDRRLDTEFPGENQRLWCAARYDAPPRVEQMIAELASFTEGSAKTSHGIRRTPLK